MRHERRPRDRNTYSLRWFQTFLGTIDESRVAPEVEFLCRRLPPERFPRLLDLCSGPGRHAIPLAGRGFAVCALDRDPSVLQTLRARAHAQQGQRATSIQLVGADMAALPIRTGSLDAVICMWQSFGYLGPGGDGAVLEQVRRLLRVGGRAVLDVYNRAFHVRSAGARVFERAGVNVREERLVAGDRLHVRLGYDREGTALGADEFEWTLYEADTLAALARAAGFRVLLVCSGFDEDRPVTTDEARMQLVLEAE